MRSPLPFALGMLLAVSGDGSVLAANSTTRDPGLVAQLKAAATQADRLALLPDDSDWKFDFNVRSSGKSLPNILVNGA